MTQALRPLPDTSRPLTVLGVESSCDDTAAAVVRSRPGAPAEILASVVLGQEGMHAAFGGIVPEIAARAHAERLDLVTEAALGAAGLPLGAIDAIAVTAGPGLIGGVLAGVMFARGLAAATGLQVVGVNHLAGHALTPRLTDAVDFPFLVLIVSGGHCQFLIAEGSDRFHRLGGTIDDAPGEAFDKVAKLLGLPQPGGPAIEAAAATGDPRRFVFPRPLVDRPGCDMSFSGLKTAVIRARETILAQKGQLSETDRADICASFQAAVADVLAARTARAIAACRDARVPVEVLAVAGGVAANATIRAGLRAAAEAAGLAFVAPPLRLCTDNGAVIAWTGIERLRAGAVDAADLVARPRWPLDTEQAGMLGGGRKGPKA
ncbi:MAG: tRNA (adenosine(37)-N6)-threonylcarbamoyltransferase complex transferase subunit TsaD [Gemmobacter sp.]